ncbi:MAG: hypothetical protein ACKVPX_17160 [Myxococcaceae bacterium]
MTSRLDAFYNFLNRPLFPKARVLLAMAVVPLALALMQPLWRIAMTAPQYPRGLEMNIYAYKLEGGNDGADINEINTLNHYIGMHKLDAAAAADLDWIPFALGAILLLALRAAVIGNVRHVLDLFVVTGYLSAFAFGRFVYRLWVFGHDLDPRAPVHVEPFMPVILGHKTVANFEVYSYPLLGSYLVTAYVLVLVGVLIWHLHWGRTSTKVLTAQGQHP